MTSARKQPRTYSKKAHGETSFPIPRAVYRDNKTVDWNAFPTPAPKFQSTSGRRRPTQPKQNGTKTTGITITDREFPVPSKPKVHKPYAEISAPHSKGKAKDKTGATVVEIEPNATHGFKLPLTYDASSASADPIAALKGVLDTVKAACKTINEWNYETLPIPSIADTFDNLHKALSTAVLHLDQTEHDRAVDLVATLERDEKTADFSKSRLAAEQKTWDDRLQLLKGKYQNTLKEQAEINERNFEKAVAAEVQIQFKDKITRIETFWLQKAQDTKKRCEAEFQAKIEALEQGDRTTTHTVSDVEAKHQETIDDMERLYSEQCKQLKSKCEKDCQKVRADCDRKIAAMQAENQDSETHADTHHDLVAKHKAEIEELQKEREEFQRMLLDNNDRLTAENLRLQSIIDSMKNDNVSDFDNDIDSYEEENPFRTTDSPIKVFAGDTAQSSPAAVNINVEETDDSASASLSEKENKPARKPLAALARMGVARSPSPEGDEEDVKEEPESDDDHFFDADEAHNSHILSYIDGPEVSPTAGRSSSSRKRALADAGLEESPTGGRAAKRPTLAPVGGKRRAPRWERGGK
ncbi:hypothetical protein CC80DRAFT_546123 [Byssothecium circinans]|uniref:Uncharacterized protein n=1 Tax=Byssothecium circinans TaxID=147558 RepID=A0A6A5U1T2_9PLEO|nr:hypothetical protein CC80DRAFT_546123 [Byssothecium circinans]